MAPPLHSTGGGRERVCISRCAAGARVALLFGMGGATLHFFDRSREDVDDIPLTPIAWQSAAIGLTSLAAVALAMGLGLLRWKIELPHPTWADWNGYAQLLIWFTWPAWPFGSVDRVALAPSLVQSPHQIHRWNDSRYSDRPDALCDSDRA